MTPPHTIASMLGNVAEALAEAGLDDARRRARRLLAAALGLTQEEVFARIDRMVTEDEGERIAEMLRRALKHEPLSRIQGKREFWGLEFKLSPDTLDPRPETETLVEAVLARLAERDRPYRFLDLGTGTGCLLLALLTEFPQARGIGIDRAWGSAATAHANALCLGVAGRAGFAVGDWAASISGQFEAIVANPPYIPSAEIAALPPEVHDFDPVLALDGGIDGLDAYWRIARDLPRLLAPGGIFACEVGAGQDGALAGILAGQGLVVVDAVPDLAGIARCIVARPKP
ncbi:MAG: peptide chain release factor N(5)-glutamine methyltransferase [Stellaceae bacterium]